MKKCPFCAEEIPEESRVCKFCNTALVRKCPFCAEEIQAAAKKCRFCQSSLESPVGEGEPKPTASWVRAQRTLGEDRGVALTVILSIVTCGVYGWVAQYQIGNDLNRHQEKGRLQPGLDILWIFLTCGLWTIYVSYKYAKILQEITIEEEVPVVDIALPCILLTVFGLHLVTLAILQHELNRHWEGHRTLRASGL